MFSFFQNIKLKHVKIYIFDLKAISSIAFGQNKYVPTVKYNELQGRLKNGKTLIKW